VVWGPDRYGDQRRDRRAHRHHRVRPAGCSRSNACRPCRTGAHWCRDTTAARSRSAAQLPCEADARRDRRMFAWVRGAGRRAACFTKAPTHRRTRTASRQPRPGPAAEGRDRRRGETAGARRLRSLGPPSAPRGAIHSWPRRG
jgi:hypothetical protein